MTVHPEQKLNSDPDIAVARQDHIPVGPVQRFTRSVRSIRTKLTLLTCSNAAGH